MIKSTNLNVTSNNIDRVLAETEGKLTIDR